MKLAAIWEWLIQGMRRTGENGGNAVGRAEIEAWTKELGSILKWVGFLSGIILTLLAFSGAAVSDANLLVLLMWYVSLPVMLWIMSVISLRGWRTGAATLVILLIVALIAAPDINRDNWKGLLALLLVFSPAIAAVFALYKLGKIAGATSTRLFDLLTGMLHKFQWTKSMKDGEAITALMSVKSYKKYWAAYLLQVCSMFFFIGCIAGDFISWVFGVVCIECASFLFDCADDIRYVMNVVAFPWSWWESAQISTKMLKCANVQNSGGECCSDTSWLLYMFAAQFVYILLPRLPVLHYARYRFYGELQRDPNIDDGQVIIEPDVPDPYGENHDADDESGKKPQKKVPAPPIAPPTGTDAPLVHSVPAPYLLIDWDAAPEFVLEFVKRSWGTAEKILEKDELSAAAASAGDVASVVVLVKGSKPFMRELKESIRQLSGFSNRVMMPLAWDDRMQSVDATDLKHWRQTCARVPGDWSVLQPRETL